MKVISSALFPALDLIMLFSTNTAITFSFGQFSKKVHQIIVRQTVDVKIETKISQYLESKMSYLMEFCRERINEDRRNNISLQNSAST